MGTARDWAMDLAVSVAIGLLLGLMGPFGSYFNGGPWLRIAYWIGSIVCGTMVFGCLTRLLIASARKIRAPDWVVLAGVIMVGSLIQGVLSRWIAVKLWPELEQIVGVLRWYGQCVAISTPIVIAYYLLRVRRQTPGRPAGGPLPPQIAVAEPLAVGQVLCLCMEDHYVRIHTAAGSRLVAGPFERVIANVGDLEGMRVHRSWWVSRAAVIGVEVEGRNLKLRLSNGLRAPVSRASVARLRQVGWLSAQAWIRVATPCRGSWRGALGSAENALKIPATERRNRASRPNAEGVCGRG